MRVHYLAFNNKLIMNINMRINFLRFRKSVLTFMNSIDKRKEENNKKLDGLSQEVKEFKDFKTAATQRFENVEKDLDEVKTRLDQGLSQEEIDRVKAAILPQIEASLTAKFSVGMESSHKLNLARDNFQHDHILIIHGFKKMGTIEEVRKFLKENMKIPEAEIDILKIKEVTRLGRILDNNKPPPLAVKFAHPSQ